MPGITGFAERVDGLSKGLSKIHLIQQGGELADRLLHDPDYPRASSGGVPVGGQRAGDRRAGGGCCKWDCGGGSDLLGVFAAEG